MVTLIGAILALLGILGLVGLLAIPLVGSIILLVVGVGLVIWDRRGTLRV